MDFPSLFLWAILSASFKTSLRGGRDKVELSDIGTTKKQETEPQCNNLSKSETSHMNKYLISYESF